MDADFCSAAAPVALVTGAAKRIGAAIARRLHAAGFDLIVHHHESGAEAAALAAELNARRGDSAHALAADLRAFDRIPELVAHAIGRFGRLDALVNNASAYFDTPFGHATPAQWDALFAINARAPFFLAQAAAPHLVHRRGAIVNLIEAYAERPRRDIARDAVQGMPHSTETGGLSGAPVLEASNRVIRQLRAALGRDFPIVGVGGIMSAKDAVSKIEAGADVVQIYTGLIYEGPALVEQAAKAIKASRGKR